MLETVCNRRSNKTDTPGGGENECSFYLWMWVIFSLDWLNTLAIPDSVAHWIENMSHNWKHNWKYVLCYELKWSLSKSLKFIVSFLCSLIFSFCELRQINHNSWQSFLCLLPVLCSLCRTNQYFHLVSMASFANTMGASSWLLSFSYISLVLILPGQPK